MKKSIRPWLAAAGSFLLLFTSVGLGANGMTLFYIPVAADLGFTQTGFSLYYTIALLSGMLVYPLFGRFYTKHPEKMKLSMLIAGVITLLCFFLYSRSNTLMEFYIISVFRGVCNSALSTVPATMIINSWFSEKRSLMVSISFMGSSLGGLAYTQISKAVMAAYGWSAAYWVSGFVGFLTVVIVLLITAVSPTSVGQKPYGYKEGDEKSDPAQLWGVDSGKALKSAVFWIFGFGIFLAAGVTMGMQQYMTSTLQVDFGHSGEIASRAYSVFMVFICLGKIVVGWMYDRFNIKVGILYGSILIIASLLCMVIGLSPVWMVFAFAVLFGLGNMNSTVTATTVTTNIFGLKDYGTIFGFISMFVTSGMSLGPLVAAAIFDGTGSYTGAWTLFLAVMVIATLMQLTAAAMSKKLREN